MAYAVNGVPITAQPERHRWVDPTNLGIDGNNRPVYPGPREVELYWGMMSIAEFEEILGFWNQTQTTGSVTTSLPQQELGVSAYQFRDYSGTSWDYPSRGDYFEEYIQQVKVTVRNVVP